jgi:hypothetical protein
MFDAMDNLRLLGNDATHVKARLYDNIGPDEAALAIELTQEILRAVYQLQSLTDRLRDAQGDSDDPT